MVISIATGASLCQASIKVAGGVGGWGGEVVVRGVEGGRRWTRAIACARPTRGGRKKLRGNGEACRMSFTDAMPSSPVTMVTGPCICGLFFSFLKFSSVQGTNSEP